MLSIKKTIATITAFVMVLGCTGAVMADTNETASKHAEAITTLGALGIMVGDKDTNEFRESDPIKRSEFAKVAIHALGLDELANASSGSTRFPDVVDGHWATGYINVATQQGIIIGDTAGNFRPDDDISYAEAMTILVRMLGFEPSAKARGGFPGGYILVGTERGLANRVSVTASAVNRGSVAQMTFNSLTANLMEQTGFGSNADYSIVDKTLLEDKLEVEKFSGMVNANEHTALSGFSPVGKGKVMIGDTILDSGNHDYSALLGSYVKAYAKEDDTTGERTLILAIEDESKTSHLTVEAEDIDSLTARSLEYWSDRDTDKNVTKADIADTAQLIYNSKADDMANLSIPASGSVTLVDNNGDEVYDIIMINERQNLVVEDTSSVTYTITDKYGNGNLVLDPTDNTASFTLTDKNGDNFAFENLAEWDIISYTKSRDGKLTKAIVVREGVQGTVTEKNAEKVVINDTDYEIAANYSGTVSLGDEGMFMLDIDGKIAAIDKNVSLGDSYAYLINAAVSGGVDQSLQIQLFNSKGENVILKAAENLRIDTNRALSASEALSILKDGGERVSPQLVTYALNAEGEVSAIERAADKTLAPLDSYKGIFVKNADLTDAVYKSQTNKLGSITLDENTIVFDIPEGETDTAKYSVRDYTMFANDAQYNALVYDLTEEMTASVIIVTNASSAESFEAPVTVVERITEVNNQDGVSVLKIYGYQGGEPVELIAADGEELIKSPGNKIETGDVIVYKTNLAGEVDGITVLFDTDNKTTEFEKSLSADVSVMYGKVAKKFAGSINLTVGSGAAENFKLSGATVYKFDSTKSQKNISIVSASDIQKYDDAAPERVFMRLEKGVPADIVIVK